MYFLNPVTRNLNVLNKCFWCNVLRKKFIRFQSIKLAYECFEPTQVKNSPPIIIIHGMLGSKRNWKSLGKAFSNLGQKVITVDVRNHGDSPFTSEMNYELMSDDVATLISDFHLEQAVVLGHSMGGKVAMTLALQKPHLVCKLIVEDVAPVDTPTAVSLYPQYLTAMKHIEFNNQLNIVEMRRNITEHLQKVVKDRGVVNFLLTNLQQDEKKQFFWSLNIDGILSNVQNLAVFPSIDAVYTGPTLFVAGGRSDYIKDIHVPGIMKLFPNAEIVRIPQTGHWVHAESPGDFMQTVLKFLNSK